jgi:hypothetical protein
MTVVREGIDLVVPHAEELFVGGSWQPPATGAGTWSSTRASTW